MQEEEKILSFLTGIIETFVLLLGKVR